MPYAELDPDTRISYRIHGGPQAGAQPDLVLLHGTGGSSATTWTHLLDPLGAEPGRRRIITIDYAGSGETTDAGGPLEIGALAAQVRAAIDDAGSERFDLLGFSLGAVVAAQLAATSPAGLHRLILLSGWARSADDSRLGIQMALWQHLAGSDPQALASLLALTGYSPQWLGRRPRRAAEQAIRQTVATLAPGFARQAELDARIDLTEQLPRIAAPTLVLAAAHDHMIPPHHGQALAAAIPGAEYDELPTGHLAIYEAPELLVARVLAFLEPPTAVA